MKIGFHLLAAVAAALLTGALSAQSEADGRFGLLRTDGTFVRGEPVGLDVDGGTLRFRADGAEEAADIPLGEILSLSGAAPREPEGGVIVRLVGGDELRGEIGGGDATGETLVVRSSVLGAVAVRVDRLASIVFVDRVGADRNAAFAVPDDADEDEALFLPARRGFDLSVGMVHRFRDDGILFESRGDDAPRVVEYTTLSGFALRDGEGRAEPAGAVLLTSSGDSVGVDLVGLEEDRLVFRLEEGVEVRLRRREVASITILGDERIYLSDVPIVEARERPYFDDGDLPLWPYRLDRSVTGTPLRAGGLGFGKGIGVHARSALAFKVPDGVSALVGLVALDDSTLELPVRGAVAARVRLNDEVLFEAGQVDAAGPLQSIGRLPVRPGATLRLEVDFGPGLDLGDRADWLGVAFVR